MKTKTTNRRPARAEQSKGQMKIAEGDRVVLKPFEGEPEQAGEVLEVAKNGTITVQLDEYDDEDDDGLRDVTSDQVKSVEKPRDPARFGGGW